MSWNELTGKWGYAAGSAGTPTIPKGAVILSVMAHASAGGATLTIYKEQVITSGAGTVGDTIPIPNGFTFNRRFHHCMVKDGQGTGPLVFTGTDMYFVEYLQPMGS